MKCCGRVVTLSECQLPSGHDGPCFGSASTRIGAEATDVVILVTEGGTQATAAEYLLTDLPDVTTKAKHKGLRLRDERAKWRRDGASRRK